MGFRNFLTLQKSGTGTLTAISPTHADGEPEFLAAKRDKEPKRMKPHPVLNAKTLAGWMTK